MQTASPNVVDIVVLRGKAPLALGRFAEARDTLAAARDFWLKFDPDNAWAAEAIYWYGRALVATGDRNGGERLLEEVIPRLAASPMPIHRALAGTW